MSRLQAAVCPMCVVSHCGMLPGRVKGQRGASSRTGFEIFRDLPIWRVSLTAQASRDTHNRTFKIAVPLAAAGVLACAGAVVLTLSGSQSSNPTLDAEIRAAIIAAPIAVGLFTWFTERWGRFGKLLVAAGFAWSLTTLAQSSDEVLYSAGRVFGWIVEPLLIYLVLAFPSGRLTTRVERASRGRQRAARRCLFLADDAACRFLSDAVSVEQLRHQLSLQRLHAGRLGAGLHRLGDPALPRSGDHAAVRGRDRGARRSHSTRHAAHAHHARTRARVCDSPRGSLSLRASRRVVPRRRRRRRKC